jgi:hypothetical protein
VIEVNKRVSLPQAGAEFLASNDLAGLLKKENQYLKRLFRQLEPKPVLAKLASFEIDLEDAEPKYPRSRDGGCHGSEWAQGASIARA